MSTTINWRCPVLAACLLLAAISTTRADGPDRAALFAVPDFNELPRAVEIVSEQTEEGVKITEMYFAGAPFNGEPTRIYGFYCRPEQDGKYPGVLEIHGAGASGSQLSPAAGIAYATNGFACFVMDWAGGSAKRREEGWRHSEFKSVGNLARVMDNKAAYPPHGWKTFGPEADGIRNGVMFARRVAMLLKSKPEVDADQLCVAGMSAGAHLTLLLLGVEPAYRAAAVKYGTGFIDDIRFGGYFGPILMTSRPQQEEWLAVLDPKHGMHNYRASTLLLSGTDDIFFWMPAVLQTYRAIPTEKRLIMLPNNNHTHVGNTQIPIAWFRSVLGQTPAWPTVESSTATPTNGPLTLRTTVAAEAGIDHVNVVFKRQPRKIFHWGPRKDPALSAKWTAQAATEDGDGWSVTLPALAEGEQLVAYAMVYDKLSRMVSSDTVEVPEYPFWRGHTYQPWEKTFKATDYQRCELTDPARIADVKAAGNISGVKKGAKGHCVTGWFEYDFWAPHSGWYELIVPGGGNMEFFVDGQYAYSTRGDKVGNFYLDKTRHTIRLQRYHWTGLRAIERFTLRAIAPEDLVGHLRVICAEDRPVHRLGEDVRLRVQSGRMPVPTPLDIELVIGDNVIASKTLSLPDWPCDDTQVVSLPCSRAGEATVRFRLNGKAVAAEDVPPIQFDIIDTTSQPAVGGEVKRTLLQEIDCAAVNPDYAKGETRVIRKPFGAYRESGMVGWKSHMNSTEPTWFAYTITVPEVQVPYIVEVDYPDDALRTFCIAIREGVAGAYPSAGGVDSGGEWPLSHSMFTHSIIYWPRSTDLRVLVIPALDHRRAAAARIRAYKIEGELPLPAVPREGGRHFANWYEEGSNFRSVFGGGKSYGPDAVSEAELADRWARTMRYMGADTLWMTMVVYQFGLYPSHYNVNFGGPYSGDLVGKVILACERYGMDFIGEFHPEGRELDWPVHADPEGRHRAINRNGERRSKTSEPLYNPIWPANREWYLGMIGEFVDRYKESPALHGVCLRTMTWASPGLSNFHGLDWGYDDYTIGRFVADTGTRIPVAADAPDRFRRRYDWLLANAREAWIDWRCDQIAELYRQAVARVRQARPNLVVLTGLAIKGDPREAGLDPAKLAAIDGLVLTSGVGYGRRLGNELAVQEERDRLLDLGLLSRGVPQDGRRMAFRFGSNYFEATGVVVVPADLGFSEKTKPSWMSGVVNPAGRHCNERWAVALAETDVSFLSDGGNAYTVGQPLLREFLADYRNLPALPFTPREDARDPVAVWSREVRGHAGFADGFYFYAVNRERYPVAVRVTLKNAPELVRVSTGTRQPLTGGTLALDLKPYELQGFRAPAGATIEGVVMQVPEEAKAHAIALVEFLEQLAATARENKLGMPIEADDVALLSDRAAAARQALDRGHLWRARTMIEHHELRRLYDRLKRQPPNLRDCGAPVAPETALLCNVLRERLRQGTGKLIPSEQVTPLWGGDELLVSADDVLEFSIDVPIDALNEIEIGRVAGGDYGDIELAVNGKVIGVLRDPGGCRGVVSRLPGPALLARGETRLRVRRLSGSAIAIRYVQLSPVYTDIPADRWLGAGPFMVDPGKGGRGVSDAVRTAMTTPAWQAVESARDLDAPITLPDGSTTQWQPLAGSGDFMDFAQAFDRNMGCISYAVTHIQSPTAAHVRLSYGMDYWMLIWVNGELVQNYAPHGGAPFKGQFHVDVPLREGNNEMLVKVASGSLGNGFWMAISDPGNLSFSARSPEPEESSKP